MQSDILTLGVAYLLGLGARSIGLPPLIGYLVAGFVLFASGGVLTPTLKDFSEMGVTLLLFSIGLKLQVRSLLMPQIWAVSSLHMLVTVIMAALFINAMAFIGISQFSGLDSMAIALIAFALSFSSTVFAVKVLDEKGEMNSLYGRIAIGILIMQDIAAVIFLAASTGKVPTIWALGLLLLIPLRPLLFKVLEKSGHGELQILFGLTVALGGAQMFELVSVKGDLGALILGIIFANHVRAPELSRQLLGFKDLFLVGFFLSIGLSGPLSWNAIVIGVLLLLLVPLKTVFFFWLMSKFSLRARTSFLGSLSLANYSEFGLIVIAVSVSNAWLGSEWLIIIAIALSLSFIFAAPLNSASYLLYSRMHNALLRFESRRPIAAEAEINSGDASVIVFGMGRVGSGAYHIFRQRVGDKVLGVDHDATKVEKLHTSGINVIRGSAIDPDFWNRINMNLENVKVIVLSMPNAQENLFAAKLLKETGYTGQVAAVARYADEIEALKKAGVDAAFNLYAESGAGFAEHVCSELLLEPS
jgi:predicted Kef-type K+ transport protein